MSNSDRSVPYMWPTDHIEMMAQKLCEAPYSTGRKQTSDSDAQFKSCRTTKSSKLVSRSWLLSQLGPTPGCHPIGADVACVMWIFSCFNGCSLMDSFSLFPWRFRIAKGDTWTLTFKQLGLRVTAENDGKMRRSSRVRDLSWKTW